MVSQTTTPPQGIIVPTDPSLLKNPGALVIDTGRRILYSSDGNNSFVIGANLVDLNVSNAISVGNSSVNVVINSSAISVSGVGLSRGYTGSQGVGFTGSQGTQGVQGYTGSLG